MSNTNSRVIETTVSSEEKLNDRKTRPVMIKVSENEYRQIEDKANKLGLSVSAYFRFAALNADISVAFGID